MFDDDDEVIFKLRHQAGHCRPSIQSQRFLEQSHPDPVQSVDRRKKLRTKHAYSDFLNFGRIYSFDDELSNTISFLH
jgi:hypothetical protein